MMNNSGTQAISDPFPQISVGSYVMPILSSSALSGEASGEVLGNLCGSHSFVWEASVGAFPLSVGFLRIPGEVFQDHLKPFSAFWVSLILG